MVRPTRGWQAYQGAEQIRLGREQFEERKKTNQQTRQMRAYEQKEREETAPIRRGIQEEKYKASQQQNAIDDLTLGKLQKGITEEEMKAEALSDSTLLSTILSMPEEQQQQAFNSTWRRLSPDLQKEFQADQESGGLVFDKQKAMLFQSMAKGVSQQGVPKFKAPIKGEDSKGNPVWLQWDETGTTLKQVEGEFRPPAKKGGISMTTAAGDVLQVGGEQKMKLDKPVMRKQQQKIIDAQTTLGNLERIKALVSPEFFERMPRGRRAVVSELKKWGISKSPEDKEYSKKYRMLRNEVEQEFNAYRKEITGAAAAIKELEVLRDSFINMDLDHDEFLAAMVQYEQKKLRGLRLAKKLLREGVTVGDKGFGKKMDDLWMGGDDDDPDERGEELIKQGMTFEEATEQLRVEGYKQGMTFEEATEQLRVEGYK